MVSSTSNIIDMDSISYTAYAKFKGTDQSVRQLRIRAKSYEEALRGFQGILNIKSFDELASFQMWPTRRSTSSEIPEVTPPERPKAEGPAPQQALVVSNQNETLMDSLGQTEDYKYARLYKLEVG